MWSGNVRWVMFRFGKFRQARCGSSWWVEVRQGSAGEVGSVLVDQVGCGSAGLVRLDWVRSGLVT